MDEGGRDGGRAVVRDEGRDSARGGDFAVACQSLPASRARSVGAGMAAEGGARRRDRGAVRGRRGVRIPAPGRSRKVPGGIAGASAEGGAGRKWWSGSYGKNSILRISCTMGCTKLRLEWRAAKKRKGRREHDDCDQRSFETHGPDQPH